MRVAEVTRVRYKMNTRDRRGRRNAAANNVQLFRGLDANGGERQSGLTQADRRVSKRYVGGPFV